MVKVSVIIISYNNFHYLKRNLNSLINQTYNHSNISVEFIVVDSGSRPESLRVLEKYKDKVKIVLKPQFLSRLSPAEARNMGVQNSSGDILIFSDADCILPSTLVQDVFKCFNDQRIDCVFGSREPDMGSGLGTFIRRFNFILYSNKLRILRPTVINKKTLADSKPFISLSGNNFAIRRDVWVRLGGMKTTYKNPAGEDIMLENDLIENNYTLLFDPFIKVIHFHPVSLINLFKKFAFYGKSNYAVSKYPSSLINYKCFIDRGHQLSLKNFIIFLLFAIFIISIVAFGKASVSSILFGLFILFLVETIRLIKLKKRLSSTLVLLGENYKKKYTLSIFQLFYFDLINSAAKTVTFLSFYKCYFLKSASTLDSLLKNKSNDYIKEARQFRKKAGFDLSKGYANNAPITTSCSIIIPFCNNYFFLERTLHALCHQMLPDNFKTNKMEIIVVNDGSPVGLEKLMMRIAKIYSTTYLKLKKNYGAASARNLGLLYAKNEIVIFLDEDMVVTSDFIASHLSRHTYLKNCVMVGFRQNITLEKLKLHSNNIDKATSTLPDYKNDFRYKRFVPQEWSYLYKDIPSSNFNKEYHPLTNSNFFREYGKGKFIGVWDLPSMFLSCNVSVRKKHVMEVGGFDMRFKNCGMEDTHLGAKLIAKNLYLIPNLHATAYHLVDKNSSGKKRTTLRNFERKFNLYRNLRNEALVVLKQSQWKKQMENYFANKFEVIGLNTTD